MENRKTHFSAFTLCSKDHRRTVTVINGIPFYCSTGRSSNQEGTWLPFLGLREENNWMVKPEKINDISWPADVATLIQKLDSSEFTFKRLGTLESMCISASLNSGYWLTKNGKELKNYLSDNYSQYFLSESQVAEIAQLTTQEQLEEFSADHPQAINNKIREMGATAILNSTCRLLPLPTEKALYADENIRKLMIELDTRSLLNQQTKEFLPNEIFQKALAILITEKTLIKKNVEMVITLARAGLLDNALPLLNYQNHRQKLCEMTDNKEISKYINQHNPKLRAQSFLTNIPMGPPSNKGETPKSPVTKP